MTNIMLAPYSPEYSPATKPPPPVFATSLPPFLEPASPPFNSSPSPSTPPITLPATLAPPALSSTMPLPTSSEPPVTPFPPLLPSPSSETLIAPDNSPTRNPPSTPTLLPAEAPSPSPVASASQPLPFPPGGVAPALPTTATFTPPEAMPPDRKTTSPPPSTTISPFTEPPSSSTAEPPEVKLPSVPLSSGARLPVAVEVQKLSGFNISSGLIVGLAIGAVIFVFVFAIVAVLCRNRKKRTQQNLEILDMHHHHESSPCVESKGSHVIRVLSNPSIAFGSVNGIFTFDELVVATKGFSEDNLVGQGGFGYVYKGVLPCGKEIAVKQLKTGSQQGEREFQAEVETISQVHHKHLVELLGYCVTNAERLLVYEFVPNNTLEFHLHGEGKAVIEWATRIKIALGSAKGLAYLHEDCNPAIIHRDIKASNILLDFKFEPKVSDFGLAKIFPNTDGCITHLTTRVMGTFGYLAPEYASSGKLTDKSDVYSYGVMLLELITGRGAITAAGSRNVSLVDWARPLLAQALQDGDFNNLVDPRLQKKYGVDEMARMIICAAACVRHSARLRPRMIQIVGALEGLVSLTDLVGDITPGHTTMYSWSDSSTYGASQYQQDLRIFNLALSCHKYSSTGHGESTSPYGLHPSSSCSGEVHQQTIRDL